MANDKTPVVGIVVPESGGAPGRPSALDAPLATAGRDGEQILRFFEHAHLPPALAAVSKPFATLADHIMTLPRSAERTVALRKLLEAKDAAVRAALPAPGAEVR